MYSNRTKIICFTIFVIGMCMMFGYMRYGMNNQSDVYTGPQVCRITGCGKVAYHSDWGRRFCYEHIDGDKYCHFGSCENKLPRNSKEIYCASCIAYNKSRSVQ